MTSLTETFTSAIDNICNKAPVLPVLTIHDPALAVPLAETLRDAGLPVLEVTLRTDAALAAIRRMRDEVSGITVGAGTILNGEHLRQAEQAGAEFAISPGCTEALYQAAEGSSIPFLPGVATAGEIMRGLEHGHTRFKFFPAQAAGGVAALSGFNGPLAEARFCPTGGIGPHNAADYLALANVMTIGGSWMVPGGVLKARDWQTITRLAAEAAQLKGVPD